MTTKEVARYLGINEKQVYALIKSGKMPSTRVTGKWVFPRNLIDEWIEKSARGAYEEAGRKAERSNGALLASGSNDPVLEMLLSYRRRIRPDIHIFSENTGSTEGLKALAAGYTDIAWSHLLDPGTSGYNIPFLSTYAPERKLVILNLFYRELGIMTSIKNPLKIKSFEDLAGQGVRIINRQAGSGTRVFLDYRLERLGMKPESLEGYGNEVFTHLEVGLAILSGKADAGLATRSASQILGLHFIPLARESFDMIVGQEDFFKPGIQTIIETVKSPDFRKHASVLEGYDFRDSGKILHAAT
jgi:excisionase family DNA binding protein